MPGVRLNLGKTGVSLSAGVRGASVTLGKRGLYSNVGIPGTGLSSRQRLAGGPTRSTLTSPRESPGGKFSVVLNLEENGTLSVHDEEGRPFSDDVLRLVKRQSGDQIQGWLAEQCEKYNSTLVALEEVYHDTPAPDDSPKYQKIRFVDPEPIPPESRKLTLLDKVFKSRRERVERENSTSLEEYEQAHKIWAERKKVFNDKELQEEEHFERGLREDPGVMSDILEARLSKIEWPRETLVNFELNVTGETLHMDVDLPEIEDLPQEEASYSGRGWKLNIKRLSETRLRKIYMTHVHGIGFRLIGVAFATLPTVGSIALSAYSQRVDKLTGHTVDEYFYSVIVNREQWSRIKFNNLEELDVTAVFESFHLVRKMTKTGVFKPIEPIG